MRPTVVFALGLAACAAPAAPGSQPTHASPTSVAISFAAQSALDRWVAMLRTETPDCSITVRVLANDEAQLAFEDPHEKRDPNAPAMQIQILDYVWVEPFVLDAEVASRREATKRHFAACMAEAGPGPRAKGRDMHAESCAMFANDGPPIPTAHLDRDLSVAFPANFGPPAVCEKATLALKARLAPYPIVE